MMPLAAFTFYQSNVLLAERLFYITRDKSNEPVADCFWRRDEAVADVIRF